jgi:hypothetical protein
MEEEFFYDTPDRVSSINPVDSTNRITFWDFQAFFAATAVRR